MKIREIAHGRRSRLRGGCFSGRVVQQISPPLRRVKIIHLAPFRGDGGLEAACRALPSFRNQEIDFRVGYMFNPPRNRTAKYLSLFYSLSHARKIVADRVDVLIVSLWRACIVGAIVKMVSPDVKLVLFLHCATDAHVLDRIATRAAAWFAEEIWADSQATLTRRLASTKLERSRVISFLVRRFEAAPPSRARASFIFWGRLTAQKGLEHALRLFACLHAKEPDARFRIIGPDGGSLASLKTLSETLGLRNAVIFCAAATHNEIADFARDASFYLQTSRYEGMAMSVMEAMQMGLVPVVTAVGEIGSYCRNDHNAIIIESDAQAITNVLDLLRSPRRYERLRAAAIDSWKQQPLYRDSMLKACGELVDRLSLGAIDKRA